MRTVTSGKWWSLALPAVAMAATAALFTPLARLAVDPYHDGIMLKPALDLLAGQTLFRDTFSMYGIGISYLQAATLWLFGPTLAVLRLTTVGVYAIAAAFLVDAWRRLLPPGLALLALAFWLVLPGFYGESGGILPWCSVWAILFQAIALDALVCALLGGPPVPLGLLAGAACAMVFLCRQPVGAVTSIAVLLGFAVGVWRGEPARPRRLALLACAAGLALVLGLAGVFLLASGTLGDWYLQTVEWPRRWVLGRRGSGLGNVLGDLVRIPTLTLPWIGLGAAALLGGRLLGPAPSWRRVGLLVVVIAAGAFACLRSVVLLLGALSAWMTGIPLVLLALGAVLVVRVVRGRVDSVDLAAFGGVAVGLVSWLQYFPVPCPHHMFWSVTPGAGLVVYAAWLTSGRRATLTAAVVIFVMLPGALGAAIAAHAKLGLPWVRLDGGVLDGMWVLESQAPDWRRLVTAVDAEVRRRPGVPMLVEGDAALYAALVADRRNPGPFYVDWGIPGVQLTPRRVRFIEETRPLVFVQRAEQPELADTVAAAGYTEVFRGPQGRLLVPGGTHG